MGLGNTLLGDILQLYSIVELLFLYLALLVMLANYLK